MGHEDWEWFVELFQRNNYFVELFLELFLREALPYLVLYEQLLCPGMDLETVGNHFQSQQLSLKMLSTGRW